jgi:crotonobetainyl-CoA:carnitine CoA-transferase CaiB-like acyl-CoA transferase
VTLSLPLAGLRLAVALGRPGWPDDPRFASDRALALNRAALGAHSAVIVASAPTAVCCARPKAAAAACAKQQPADCTATGPQTAAREMVQRGRAIACGFAGLTWGFSGVRPPRRFGSPAAGEHHETRVAPVRRPG